MKHSLANDYLQQLASRFKKGAISRKFAKCILTRAAKVKNKKKLPFWLRKLLCYQSVMRVNDIREKITSGLRGNGVGFVLSLVPELFNQGMKFLKKGQSMNAEARRKYLAEMKRRKLLKQQFDERDRKYLEIIKRTRKPLY